MADDTRIETANLPTNLPRRRTMKTLAMGAVAAFMAPSASGAAEDGAMAMASAGDTEMAEIFRADVRGSLTIGDLVKQAASVQSFRPYLFCQQCWCIIVNCRGSALRSLPPDLNITDDMNLSQAMKAVQHSKYKGSGLYATSKGLEIYLAQ